MCGASRYFAVPTLIRILYLSAAGKRRILRPQLCRNNAALTRLITGKAREARFGSQCESLGEALVMPHARAIAAGED